MINLMNHILFWDSVRLILSVCETDDELCSSQSWLPGDFREPDTEFPTLRPPPAPPGDSESSGTISQKPLKKQKKGFMEFMEEEVRG